MMMPGKSYFPGISRHFSLILVASTKIRIFTGVSPRSRQIPAFPAKLHQEVGNASDVLPDWEKSVIHPACRRAGQAGPPNSDFTGGFCKPAPGQPMSRISISSARSRPESPGVSAGSDFPAIMSRTALTMDAESVLAFIRYSSNARQLAGTQARVMSSIASA